ncbi:MAG: hypothetical protein WCG76_01995 [Verrucomicrobiota bacterium]
MAREPETYCDDSIFETGIGQVVVCRYKSGGRVETGSFLVDVYCLGVKDAFFRTFDEGEFREDCLARYFPDGLPAPKPASWGRKLVEEAARYAASLGFSPHPDYKKGARVFGGVDASECDEEFVFGNEGKPLYVQGPYDGGAKADRILATLRAKLGDDGFHYIIPLGVGGEEYDEEDDEEDEDVGIFAMDSGAGDGRPDPALVTLAESFRDQNEGFEGIEYGGKTGAMMAEDLLEQARHMKEEMDDDGGLELTIEDAIRLLQTLWNLRALPEEDRAEALRAMPPEMADYLKDAVEEARGDLTGSERLILDFRLLNADDPGEERLLLLLESF